MFNKIYNWLFQSCDHKWETIRVLEVLHGHSSSVTGYHYHLKCTRCGILKQQKFPV